MKEQTIVLFLDKNKKEVAPRQMFLERVVKGQKIPVNIFEPDSKKGLVVTVLDPIVPEDDQDCLLYMAYAEVE